MWFEAPESINFDEGDGEIDVEKPGSRPKILIEVKAEAT